MICQTSHNKNIWWSINQANTTRRVCEQVKNWQLLRFSNKFHFLYHIALHHNPKEDDKQIHTIQPSYQQHKIAVKNHRNFTGDTWEKKRDHLIMRCIIYHTTFQIGWFWDSEFNPEQNTTEGLGEMMRGPCFSKHMNKKKKGTKFYLFFFLLLLLPFDAATTWKEKGNEPNQKEEKSRPQKKVHLCCFYLCTPSPTPIRRGAESKFAQIWCLEFGWNSSKLLERPS